MPIPIPKRTMPDRVSIPDALYETNMEGKSICRVVEENSKIKQHFRRCSLDFLNNLQRVHDRVAHEYEAQFPEMDVKDAFERRLRRVARDYGLNFKELPERIKTNV
jgi:hypothetical protein